MIAPDIKTRRIVLCVPHYANRISRVAQSTIGPPLGLAYIAAVARARGFDVSILDANALGLSDEETARRIAEARPAVAGFTAVTPTVDQCSRIAARVREISPETTLVLGGTHATAAAEPTARKYPHWDLIVRREADTRFADLLEGLAAGGAPGDFEGVTYRDARGEIVSTPDPVAMVDLDTLPFPARDLLPMDRYIGPDGDRVTTMIATRGCPASCSYCYVPAAFSKKMRIRDAESVADEIELCRRDFGTRNVNFIDDTFTTDKAWVHGLCDTFVRRGLPGRVRWLCLTRVDMVDEDLLRAMKAAGCFKVEFGIESGDDEVLEAVDKKMRARQIVEGFRLARRVGLETLGFVILFPPQETTESLRRTHRFIFEADPDTIQVSFCTPYPGTTLERRMREANIPMDDDWSRYVFLTTPTIDHPRFTRDEMTAWQKKILRSFYFRPRTVWRFLASTWRKGGWGGFARSASAGVRALLTS